MSADPDLCARHQDRTTHVHCGRCGQGICPECTIPTSIGVRCRRCAGSEAPRTPRPWWAQMPVTAVLIAANLAVFALGLIQTGSLSAGLDTSRTPIGTDWLLYGPSVAEGEWWRILTTGFVHGGLVHLMLNMVFLGVLGYWLERPMGSARFAGIYAVSLLASSAAIILFAPFTPTVGASGGIFGLLAAGIVWEAARGGDALRSPLTGLLVINLVFTMLVPNVSVAGHLGGVVGGLLAGFLLAQRWLPAPLRTRSAQVLLVCGACAVCALIAIGMAPTDMEHLDQLMRR